MIFSNGDNMMALKFNTATTALVVVVSAVLALVAVTLQDGMGESLECGSVIYAPLAALPVAMVLPALYAVGILVLGFAFVPSNLAFLGLNPPLAIFGVVALFLNNVAPIIVRFVSRLKTHACQCGAVLLSQALVPSGNLPEGRGLAIRVMPSFVNRSYLHTLLCGSKRVKGFTATTLAYLGLTFLGTAHAYDLRDNIELFAVHYTGKLEGIQGKERELLEHPESHTHHNVAGNGKRDGMKSGMDWAISSQAAWKQVEGSTTRVWSLTRVSGMAVKPHEHAPLKGMM